MKAAAVQLEINLGDVTANLARAAAAVQIARDQAAELILLPEFFNSGVAHDPRMLSVPRQGREAESLLTRLARDLSVPIGGSFLTLDGDDGFNTFALVFPDGSVFKHRKDTPTMVENAYYIGGDDDGVLETPIGRVGVALCWEMIRTQTVKRMQGRVDLVLACSCWWGPAERVNQANIVMLERAPRDLARLLGVPAVHASCVGAFSAPTLRRTEPSPQHLLGYSQIVGFDGKVLAACRPESSPGVVVADLPETRCEPPPPPKGYWIHELPEAHRKAWETDAVLGAEYYRTVSRPHYRSDSRD